MISDERLDELKTDWLHFNHPRWQDGVELVEEIKRLRAELARYKTPNVDNIEVINDHFQKPETH